MKLEKNVILGFLRSLIPGRFFGCCQIQRSREPQMRHITAAFVCFLRVVLLVLVVIMINVKISWFNEYVLQQQSIVVASILAQWKRGESGISILGFNMANLSF